MYLFFFFNGPHPHADFSVREMKRCSSVQERAEESSTLPPMSELLDPDQIWKRPQYAVINIGQIDDLGRYCSLLEQLPGGPGDRNAMTASSKLGRAMKKLVSNEVTQVTTKDGIQVDVHYVKLK